MTEVVLIEAIRVMSECAGERKVGYQFELDFRGVPPRGMPRKAYNIERKRCGLLCGYSHTILLPSRMCCSLFVSRVGSWCGCSQDLNGRMSSHVAVYLRKA